MLGSALLTSLVLLCARAQGLVQALGLPQLQQQMLQAHNRASPAAWTASLVEEQSDLYWACFTCSTASVCTERTTSVRAWCVEAFAIQHRVVKDNSNTRNLMGVLMGVRMACERVSQ